MCFFVNMCNLLLISNSKKTSMYITLYIFCWMHVNRIRNVGGICMYLNFLENQLNIIFLETYRATISFFCWISSSVTIHSSLSAFWCIYKEEKMEGKPSEKNPNSKIPFLFLLTLIISFHKYIILNATVNC